MFLFMVYWLVQLFLWFVTITAVVAAFAAVVVFFALCWALLVLWWIVKGCWALATQKDAPPIPRMKHLPFPNIPRMVGDRLLTKILRDAARSTNTEPKTAAEWRQQRAYLKSLPKAERDAQVQANRVALGIVDRREP